MVEEGRATERPEIVSAARNARSAGRGRRLDPFGETSPAELDQRRDGDETVVAPYEMRAHA
jgi:hypothetical protein